MNIGHKLKVMLKYEDIKKTTNTEKKRTSWMMAMAALLGFFAVLTVLPIILSTGYTFYQTDDFNHAKMVGVFGGDIVKLFVAALRFDKKMYLCWQGTYTTMFLQAFLSPINGLGRVQLQVIMIFNILLFICSLWMFIDATCKKLGKEGLYKTIIFFSLCVI